MRYCLDSIGLHVKPSAVLRLALYRTLAVALAALTVLSAVLPAPAFAADSDQQVKTVRVGWLVNNAGFQEGTPGERLSGWGYEYLQTLSYYTKGWQYEYVSGTFTELMDMLEAGEIDLMPNISYSAEREQTLLFSSNPEGTERYYIYAKPDRDDLAKGDPQALQGLTIGCNSGVMQTIVAQQWLADEGVTCTYKEIDTGGALFEALSDGEVDAVIMNDTISSPDASPMFYIGSSDYYFAVPKSRPDLMNDINAAQRKRAAAQELAEADRIKRVTEATAEAEAMEKAGEGIANQRKAIALGIKDSLEIIQETGVGNDEANQLFMFTQWSEMMTEFARTGKTSTVVLPSDFSQSASMFEQMLAAGKVQNDSKE